MIINREVTTEDIPFKLIDSVRDNCLIIVLIIGFNSDNFR